MKINEFVDSEKISKIIILIDRFLFFDDVWCFPDNKDYISKVLDGALPVDDFIKMGQDVSKKLNDGNISRDDYTINMILKAIND